jgi:hypothetical protein
MATLYPHLTMITGKKGSGKTLFTVSLIEQMVKDNEALVKAGKEPRAIYSDIDGLQFDSILPAPDDWRDTPNNSIIIYDEVQKREEWQRTGKRINNNKMILDFTTMRKTNHIIYIITQDPQFIDSTVCKLIDHHLHVVRGFGLPASNIYHWEGYCSTPDNATNKARAISEIKFNHPKRLFDKYVTGVEKDSIKTNIPGKVKFMVIFIIMMIVSSLYLFGSSDFVDIATGEHGQKIANPDALPVSDPQNPAAPQQNPTKTNELQNELNEAKLEIERLKREMLGKRSLYVQDELIRPAMVIESTGGGCRVYNAAGDLLLLDPSECLAMSSDRALMPSSRLQARNQRTGDPDRPQSSSGSSASDAPPLF